MAVLTILALVIVAGSICGIVAVAQLRRLRTEVADLRRTISTLGARDRTAGALAGADGDPAPDRTLRDARPELRADSADADTGQRDRPAARRSVSGPGPARRPAAAPAIDGILAHLREQWMVWLGGLCVTLAGIFLVRYSIEIGLLGPLGRVLAGIALGTGLLAAGEWLRRRSGSSQPAFAALAGAGSITLYASFYAAVRLYGLVEPATAFIPMAVVAIGTMAMALIHGPVLAAFGILGAYLVPILLSSGGGQILIALIYALIVSASALLLMRYVYRPWLWWGFVAGALGWWLISLGQADADGFRTLYLCAVGYLISALPHFDWLLRRETSLASGYGLGSFVDLDEPRDRHSAVTYVLLAAAVAVTVLVNADAQSPWLVGLPFLALSFFLARRQEPLYWLPWLLLLGQSAAWVLAYSDVSNSGFELLQVAPDARAPFLLYLLVTAMVVAVLSLWNLGRGRRAAVWASLASLGPVCLVGLGYTLAAYPLVDWRWGLGTIVGAAGYLGLAAGPVRKRSIESLVVWLMIGGHLGLALAAAMLFETASLTVAIAAQIVSLAWVMRRFDLPALGWLLKLVVAAVIVRLTLNPWLPDYPTGVHWSLWTYGGSAACAAVGAWLLKPQPRIAAWAEGATLHLIVLTAWAEVRYQLYDGAVYAYEFVFTEAAINGLLFGLLSLVYYRRSQSSEMLRQVYRAYSAVLMGLSTLQYALMLVRTLSSDAWVYDAIGERPLLNLLLLAWGAPILIAWLVSRFHEPAWRRRARALTGIAAFIFVSLQIRHLWSGTVRLDVPPIAAGELYTYSAVWLVIAIAAVLAGTLQRRQDVYRAGMLLLAIVIAKLFLVDLSDLQGLLRVASFMGLGLCLLGISWLHQRLKTSTSTAT